MLGQQSRLNALSRDISRLIDALISVGNSDALTARLKAAEAEKSELEESLRQAGTPETRIDLDRVVRDTMAEYRNFVQRLESALLTDADKARAALRELLGRVVIDVDAHGEIHATPEAKTAHALDGAGLSQNVVAGARIDQLLTSIRRIRLSP